MEVGESRPQFGGSILRVFSNPWWGIATTLTTIISAALGVYFYIAGLQSPDITYSVNPIRSSLVQVGKAADFSVSFQGQPVTSSVTSATVSIWNHGKKPIVASDVLSPIRIKVGTNNRILDAKIVGISRPVINASIEKSHLDSGLAGVQFRILERDDGAQVQLIYEGDFLTPIDVLGVVQGQREMTSASERQRKRTEEEQYKHDARFDAYFASVGTLFTGTALFVIWRLWKSRPRDQRSSSTLVLGCIAFLLYVGMLLSWVVYPRWVGPPEFKSPTTLTGEASGRTTDSTSK